MAHWIMISIAVLIFLIGIVAIIFTYKNKGKKRETDYWNLFVMGAIWVPVGFIMMSLFDESSIGNIFFILGWIYFVMGLANQDKWKKGSNKFKNKKNMWVILIILGLSFLLGLIVAYLFVKK